jgi:hypothetical protein
MTETPITEEMVMALADGELDGDTATAVREEIGENPELMALYEDMLETKQALVQAFGDLASDDKYRELVAQIESHGAASQKTEPEPDNVIQVSFFRRPMPELTRLAATLVIGVGIGGISIPLITTSTLMTASTSEEIVGSKAGKYKLVKRGGNASALPKSYRIVNRAIRPIWTPKVETALKRKMPAAHRAFLEAVDLLKKGKGQTEGDALKLLQQAAEGGHPLANIAIAELVDLDQALQFYRRGLHQLHALVAKN